MPLVYNNQTQQYNYIVMSCAHCTNVTVAPTVVVVKNIAARDALKDKTGLIKVLDATADPTVNKGSAYYVYIKGLGWDKVSEEESMDIDEHTNHMHPNLELLNSYTNTNDDITLAVNLAKLLNGNKSTLSELTEDSNGNLLFKGEKVGMGDGEDPIVTTFLPFTLDPANPIMKWSVEALRMDRGVDVDVWRVNNGNDHYIVPDIYYDDAFLYVDLSTFPEGEYKLAYPKKNDLSIGYGGFAMQFQITEGQLSKSFTMQDLKSDKRVIATVWRVEEDGREARTRMDMYYTPEDTLVLNTTDFTAGSYIIRYWRNYPVENNTGNYVTEAQLNSAIATCAPKVHTHSEYITQDMLNGTLADYAQLVDGKLTLDIMPTEITNTIANSHIHNNKDILDQIVTVPGSGGASGEELENLTQRVVVLEQKMDGVETKVEEILQLVGGEGA